MSAHLTQLLSVASETLAEPPNTHAINAVISANPGSTANELCALLADKNGFFAFESALLVRPLDYQREPLGILQWNRPELWKREYKMRLGSSLFFAEDAFGVQFGIRDNSIDSFEPETGHFTTVARSLDEWANWIVENARVKTGWPLAHAWQAQYGPLRPGFRLLPKVPFVCSGQFAVENLYALSDVEGMRFRASIANQLINVPDGTQIKIKISGREN